MASIPTKMSAVQLIGHGGPEMLHLNNDVDIPVLNHGEVLIKVSAAGINNTDINTRIGWYSKNDNDSEDASWSGSALQLPRIQGADVCGEIVAVGEEVDVSRIGERVIIEPCLFEVNGESLEVPWYFGSECDGGFAEYTKIAARNAYCVDTSMTDIELASFPCSYSTAENMLTRSNVAKDDVVLVTGASGGVGSAAVQLAKARGAKVIAVTSANKKAQLEALGADVVIERSQNLVEVLGHNSVTVVVDLVAGPTWPDLLNILNRKGRYAVSGAIAGPIVELDVRTLYLKDLSFFGCTFLEPEVFGNLVKRIEAGDIKPLVAETYPLAEIGQAQASFQEKAHVGKIVLTLGSE